jgi:hypothetical protein
MSALISKKIKMIFSSIFLIVLFTLLIVWLINTYGNDLILNLISEGIGIFATVFLVERVITWREAKKRRPAKNYAYVKVIRGVGNLIYDILPSEYMKICDQIYFFGDISGSPPYITNEKYNPNSPNLSEKIMHTVYPRKNEVLKTLDKHAGSLDELISKYSNLLEPEIVLPLIILNERIENAKRFRSDPKEIEDIFVKFRIVRDLSRELLSFVETCQQIQQELFTKADRVEPLLSVFQKLVDKDAFDQDYELLKKLENETANHVQPKQSTESES